MSLRLKLVFSFLAMVAIVGAVGIVAFQINDRVQQRVSGLSRQSGQVHAGAPGPNESIEVEGVWNGWAFIATDLEYLPGARRPKLRGPLEAVSARSRAFTLYGVRIHVDDQTEFDAGAGGLSGLSQGVRIEVSCSVDSSGTWFARRIRSDDIKRSDKVKGSVTAHAMDGEWPDTLVVHGLVVVTGREKTSVGTASELHRITAATQVAIVLRRIESLSAHLAADVDAGGASGLEDDLLASVDEFERQVRALGASPTSGKASLASLAGVTSPAPDGSVRTLRGHTERFVALLHTRPDEARAYSVDTLQPLIRDRLEPVLDAYRLEAEEQLAEDVGEVVSDTEAVKRILIVTSLVALVLAIALALGLWRTISGPLAALREAAARIGGGALDTRVSVHSNDELGMLAGSFNLMAERLSESTVSIEKLNAVEEELRVSLSEKELLLKEIHHRVKNNLQIVSSLIDLQSSHIDDPDTLALFAESRSRIRSMALIHEQLYRSTDMDRIDFETYIELLVDGLARSVSVSPRVNIRTDVRPFRLDIDRAVACGLIVNELVTNAVKHAFPQDTSGEIQVRFGCERGEVCELVVSDNGTGIEPGKEMSDSLGMELVESLVGQLGGEMAVSSNGGSRFSITFPAGGEEKP